MNDIPRNEEALNQLADELRAKGRRAIALLADVSVEEEVKAMVERVVEELGELNVVSAAPCLAGLRRRRPDGRRLIDMPTF